MNILPYPKQVVIGRPLTGDPLKSGILTVDAGGSVPAYLQEKLGLQQETVHTVNFGFPCVVIGTAPEWAALPSVLHDKPQANCQVKCNGISKKTSRGECQERHLRGLMFRQKIMPRISASDTGAISAPFGRNSRIKPLVFSFVPRCHGEWGSAK